MSRWRFWIMLVVGTVAMGIIADHFGLSTTPWSDRLYSLFIAGSVLAGHYWINHEAKP